MPVAFELDKLVRHKIVDQMEMAGQVVVWHVMEDDVEFRQALVAKMDEEAEEAKTGTVKELADSKEADDTMERVFGDGPELQQYRAVFEEQRKILGVSVAQVAEVQEQIRSERGDFAARIFVHKVTCQDGDPWITYYRREPNRFKEVAA